MMIEVKIAIYGDNGHNNWYLIGSEYHVRGNTRNKRNTLIITNNDTVNPILIEKIVVLIVLECSLFGVMIK